MNGRSGYRVRIEGVKYGASFGSALAIAISYTTNHSILWAIIHGILGWLYVIYFALFRA
jgi:ABC-type Fe3+-siderophore transport system permease subunit